MNALLYGSNTFGNKINLEILLRIIYYIKSTKCFERRLLESFFNSSLPFPINSFYILSFITISRHIFYLPFITNGCIGDIENVTESVLG